MDSNRKEIIVVEPGKVKVVESPLLTQPLGKEEFVVALDSACYDPADNVILHGLYPGQKPFPFRLGLEGLGTIEQVGEGLSKDLIGRKCLMSGRLGTFATRFVAPRSELFVLDKDADLKSAAENFVINPVTAYDMVQMAKERKSKAIIHTAASSHVGKWITLLAKQEGIPTITIVRNKEHETELLKLGASEVISSSESDYQEKLKAAVKQYSPSVLMDALGGEKPMAIFAMMPFGSVLITYGVLENRFLQGVGYPSLVGQKSVIAYFYGLDALTQKGYGYVEQIINRLLKLEETVHQTIQYFDLEQADQLIKEWPNRKTRLAVRASHH